MALFDQFNAESDYGHTGLQAGVYGTGAFGGFNAGLGVDDGAFEEDPVVGSSGFVTATLEEEDPLFQKVRLPLPSLSQQAIALVAVGDNVMVMALSNGRVLRKEVRKMSPEAPQQEVVELDHGLGRKGTSYQIHSLFVDPTGTHILACIALADAQQQQLKQFETVHWYGNNKTAVKLKRWSGVCITSVAWNPTRRSGEEKSSREILVGNNQGLVFETELDGSKDKLLRQVYKVEGTNNRPEPITGLFFEQLPSARDHLEFFIMITTPSRAFQFVGTTEAVEPPLFSPILGHQQNMRFWDLPGTMRDSQLSFLAKYPRPPMAFAWITPPGTYYGELDFESRLRRTEAADGQSVLTVASGAPKLLPYTRSHDQDGRTVPMPPVGIALTDFHIVLLYPDQYQVISTLTKKVVMTENFLERHTGRMKGLAVDPVSGAMYAFSERLVFQIEPTNETRDVWKLYLEQERFNEALRFCSSPAHKDKVLTAQAEKLFADGDYVEAADVFAQTQRSFEDIALRFIGLEEKDSEPLRTFLRAKLASLNSKEKTQLTMLCTWLVEIYLNSLNSLRDGGDQDAYEELQAEFRSFLEMPIVLKNLNKPTAYDLIASHGNVDDLVFYANLIQDHERVISHYVQQGQFDNALKALTRQPRPELVYRFAPALMQHAPRELVNSCMQRSDLDPRQLIPAFIRYQQSTSDVESESMNQAIRYLEFCVSKLGNQDAAIHNYLISLYVKLPDETRLLMFLEQHGESPMYDLKYALRLCTQEGKQRACVAIYSTMGLYEEAVDLALKVDLQLARINADMPAYDQELRKKLWLRIARHVVEQERDIKKAMAVLQQCELLKIEDILPFFPDFVTIDHFQADICKSLEEYNHEIEDLRRKMDNATRSAQSIRSDIQDLRNKYGVIAGNEACALCMYPLLTRAFYLFPCQHAFHADCLTDEVVKHFAPAQKRKLQRLQDKHSRCVADLRSAEAGEGEKSLPAVSAALTHIKGELDELVAEDCPLCGEVLIKSIDEPFINPEDEEELLQSWSVGLDAPEL